MLLVTIKWNEKQYTQLRKIKNFIDPFLGVVRLPVRNGASQTNKSKIKEV